MQVDWLKLEVRMVAVALSTIHISTTAQRKTEGGKHYILFSAFRLLPSDVAS
jgi:hypothetical protein